MGLAFGLATVLVRTPVENEPLEVFERLSVKVAPPQPATTVKLDNLVNLFKDPLMGSSGMTGEVDPAENNTWSKRWSAG
jgi:hypothetical protein